MWRAITVKAEQMLGVGYSQGCEWKQTEGEALLSDIKVKLPRCESKVFQLE